MSPDVIGLVGVVFALAFIFLGTEIAVSMVLVGMVGVSVIVGSTVGFERLAPTIMAQIGSYDLAVLPLFILMGQLMFVAGSGGRMYRVARLWLGRLPGGLAIATIMACAIFAAISGSAIATAATIGAFALPEMRRAGYPMGLASATVAASGTLGVLIPPSVTFIIYGILVNESIGELFVAGIVPGLLLALGFALVVMVLEGRRGAAAIAENPVPWAEKFRALLDLAEPLILLFIVVGGMFGGVFTPNEAGAIGVLGALVSGLLRRSLTRARLSEAITETVLISAVVVFIIAASSVLSTFLTVTRIPFTLADTILASDLPQPAVLALIALGYLVAGMVMEILPVIIITVPIFAPIIQSMGYDLIWFGVLIVILGQVGMITPPIGINVFVVGKLLPEVKLSTIFRSAWWFVGVMLCLVALLILWKDSIGVMSSWIA